MNLPSTFLDGLLIKLVQLASVLLPVEPAINFPGLPTAGPVVDNPTNQSTDIYLPGSSLGVPLSPTTGTFTPSATQTLPGVLQFTGTLTGNLTIVLPANQGQAWVLDFSAVVFAGHTITVQANGNNWGTAITAENVYRVTYTGTKLWGSTLTA